VFAPSLFVVLTDSRPQLRMFARFLGGFLMLASSHEGVVRGQEARLIDTPVPKVEAPAEARSPELFATTSDVIANPHLMPPSTVKGATRRNAPSRFALDRPTLALGLVQSASELYDGYTTRYFLRHCSTCVEVDPVSHFLLGSKPAWGGMLAAGSLEVIATTYLHQNMRHSSHKLIRRCAPLAPLLLTGIHFIEGSRNLPLKNLFYCADPDYVLVGNHCLLPPSTQNGSTAAARNSKLANPPINRSWPTR
jgi:hypothetical protein